MRIVIKKSITNLILDAICEEEKKHKQIDYIEVTEEEAVRLYDEMSPSTLYPWKLHIFMSKEDKITAIKTGRFSGLPIKVKENG